MRETILVSICLCLTIPAQARTLVVDDDGPADFNNIQAAIDDATHGDTIMVYDGVYTGGGNRDIDFHSKAITVRSENGPGVTIVDCENKGYGFYIVDNETSEARLEGLTIRNAKHGAIKVYSSSLPRLAQAASAGDSDAGVLYDPNYEKVIIEMCIITANPDGGILCDGHNDVTITNCTIVANGGQGIYSYMSFPTIRNCVIAKNDRTGIRATGATISNCTIVENGLYGIWVHEGQITDCIVRANLFGQVNDHDAAAIITYSDVEGGCDGPGNIDQDPLFVDPRAGDYHLQSGSPCMNAGDPDFVPQIGESDLDGRPRVRGGAVDMGAYEAGSILYVDADAVGNNDGSSWADAYNYLQDALMMASAGDEIRVARGIYKPDQFVLSKRPNLGREETFQLKSGVAIRGGYAGFGESNPNARDVATYETILSGDLSGNDDPERAWMNRGENSYHVVTSSGTNATAELDRFTITAGSADGSMLDEEAAEDFKLMGGAGIYNVLGSPTLTDCRFNGNVALSGGGMLNSGGCPTLIACTFSDNRAAAGAGMHNKDSTPSVINCTFLENSATLGGGIHNSNSRVSLIGCTFKENSAFLGGGMSNGESTLTLANCIFSSNLALTRAGGGICNYDSSLILTNCTFSGNSAAEDGGAMYVGEDASATMTSCILWDNSPQDVYLHLLSGVSLATYSSLTDGWPGETNISVDPCFADPNRGDFHLKSRAGRWNPDSQAWVQDDVTSPCIDAGDPASPIGHEPFPNGGIVNMGAYGGTAEASKSHFGGPVCETIVAGDINGDCKVDAADFRILALHWLEDRRP